MKKILSRVLTLLVCGLQCGCIVPSTSTSSQSSSSSNSSSSTIIDDFGNAISYTFIVDAVTEEYATITFTKNN